MDGLARPCRRNPGCTPHGRRDAGNFSVRGRPGKHKRLRRLDRDACRARFSEREGTPLYRRRLPEEKALAALEHLDEGCGLRPTGRRARAAGRRARAAREGLVALPPSRP